MLLFMTMVALNDCLTFPISSKALLIYFEEKPSFKANDLFLFELLTGIGLFWVNHHIFQYVLVMALLVNLSKMRVSA
ncbi:hypothetical protein DB29_01543 [Shouchella clausii]|nr:hypothetical protein DB29_01543 [Shouchella clausii]